VSQLFQEAGASAAIAQQRRPTPAATITANASRAVFTPRRGIAADPFAVASAPGGATGPTLACDEEVNAVFGPHRGPRGLDARSTGYAAPKGSLGRGS
jgi:hypothetical protein